MKKQSQILTLIVCLMALTSFADAQSNADMSVFGIKLGEKFSVPECEYTLRRKSLTNPFDTGFYSAPKKGVCFERVYYVEKVRAAMLAGTPLPPPPTDEKVLIRFAYEESPAILDNPKISYKRADIFAEIVGSYLEEISFATYGTANESEVLNSLEGKYGKPTTLTTEKMQNNYGATYNAFTATWLLQNLVATLCAT